MSDLHFSIEAIEAARQEFYDGGRIFTDSVPEAALAHDAERLAREIIEQHIRQRIAVAQMRRLTDIEQDSFRAPEVILGLWQKELLRALTEQPK